MSSFGSFLYEQIFETPQWTPASATQLRGRTAIVTGANAELGLEAAIKLAGLDPEHLILAVRTVAKGEAAKVELVKRSGVAPERVEVWPLDLASLDSVKQFSARCGRELDRLDVVCANAWIQYAGWITTCGGWEEVLQVNGIATGLLCLLLLPLLARTASLPLEPGQSVFKPHLTTVVSDGALSRHT